MFFQNFTVLCNNCKNNTYIFAVSINRPKSESFLFSCGVDKLGKYTLQGQESIHFGYFCIASTQHNAWHSN